MQSNQSSLKEPVSEEVVSDFKALTRQMVHLIREAVDAATCMLLWVNHSREQFVLAGSSTNKINTLFQDRFSFNEHFLNPYRDLKSTLLFQVDRDISPLDLDHYFNNVPVNYCAVVPIISQKETIALFVCDFEEKPSEATLKRTEAHLNTYHRVLNNYMHLTELQKDEESWNEHDANVDQIVNQTDEFNAAYLCTELIASEVGAEKVLFIAQHNTSWYCLNQIDQSEDAQLLIGSKISEDSFAYDCLQSGKEQYVVQNDYHPRLTHIREELANKSCLAAPLNIRGRRQGVFLIIDSSPYLINDVKRHKIKDMVRTLSLKLQLSLSDPYQAFLTNSHKLLHDRWLEILVSKSSQNSGETNWLVMSSLKNISHFKINRSSAVIAKLRSDVIDELMPEKSGLQGLSTEHADFVYESILWNVREDEVKNWIDSLSGKLQKVFKNYFPEGSEKPQIQSEYSQLQSQEDWLFQKRQLL